MFSRCKTTDPRRRRPAALLASPLVAICLVAAEPALAEPAPAGPAGIETGNGITLNLRDADVRDVLHGLAASRGFNLVCAPEVSGEVDVSLRDLSLDETLRAVLTLNGLTYVRRNGVIYVTREGATALEGSAWVETATFRLNYAAAEEIAAAIQPSLSETGEATPYRPTRTLVVQDTPEVIDRIRGLIAALDVPPRQVLIGARVLEIRLSDDTRMGVDWATIFHAAATEFDLSTQGFSSGSTPGVQGFFATIDAPDVDILLDALGELVDFKALAAPQVLALEGREAEIIVGGKLGFYITTTTQTSTVQSVEFLDIGSLLTITPTISDNGDVILQIHPKVSDGVVENGLPSETTTEVTTTVLVSHGQTVFIGGLIRRRDQDSRQGIPLLSEIPIVGALFGRRESTAEESELVVLITPYIVKPGDPQGARPLDLVPEQPSILVPPGG